MALTIALDGPGGAGKSTIARLLADALGILYLDTGAMYRALALKALREGIDPLDAPAAEALVARTDIAVALEGGAQRTCLDGEDVTAAVRAQQVGDAASAISKSAGVRAAMVALQQHYASQADMVLDGRDIGTRVLPGATHKFYLTATPATRARRRHAELAAKGVEIPYEQVYRELMARDAQDMGRDVDPLRPAKDAHIIDTEPLDTQGVVAALLKIIQGDGE